MRIIKPDELPTGEVYQFLIGAVAPRPIAFVSSIDENGVTNLAPYSFFNAFSSNPPLVVFSSNRRVRDNSTKDTLHNVQATGEVVINMVSHSIIQQMSVASIEFPPEVSEFEKSGLTPIPADLVQPFRVKESPVHLECKVQDIITLGDEGGAGHLVLCRIVRMHVAEEVIDERGRIDPHKIDLMGRMGRAYYVRASGEAIHTVYRPANKVSIGYDQLPENVKSSTILTGNDLGQLAGLLEFPKTEDISALRQKSYIQDLLASSKPLETLHHRIQTELAKQNVELAGQLAWLGEEL